MVLLKSMISDETNKRLFDKGNSRACPVFVLDSIENAKNQ